MDHNQIEGSIPATWATGWTRLARLTLHNNPLLCGMHPAGPAALCLDTTDTRLGKRDAGVCFALASIQPRAGQAAPLCAPAACSHWRMRQCGTLTIFHKHIRLHPSSTPPTPPHASGLHCTNQGPTAWQQTPMFCKSQDQQALPATPLELPAATLERDALLSLKQAWGSPPALRSWGAPMLAMPCGSPGWPGVSCVGGRVSGLKLPSTGLTGPASAAQHMQQLQMLRAVDLSSNALTGALPAGSAWPPALVQLQLSANMITGSLPPSWKAMQALQWLDLSKNPMQVSRAGDPVAAQCLGPPPISSCLWLTIPFMLLAGKLALELAGRKRATLHAGSGVAGLR